MTIWNIATKGRVHYAYHEKVILRGDVIYDIGTGFPVAPKITILKHQQVMSCGGILWL